MNIQGWLMDWWSRFGSIRNEVSSREQDIADLEERAGPALSELARRTRDDRLRAEAEAMMRERRRRYHGGY